MGSYAREFVLLVRKLLVEIRTVSFNLLRLQEKIASISESCAGERKAEEKLCEFPNRIAADVNFESEVVNRYYSDYHKPNGLQWATFGITVLTLIAVIVYAVVAYLQHRDLLESNQINRDALSAVQRPFVAFKEFQSHGVIMRSSKGEKKFLRFSVVAENSGNTPAIEVLFAFIIKDRHPSEEEFLDLVRKRPPLKGVVGARSPTTFGIQDVPYEIFLGKRTPGMLEFQPMKALVYLGYIAYRDNLPKTGLHLTEFCSDLASASVVFTGGPPKEIPPYPTLNFNFTQCPEHNCTDEYCPDYQEFERISQGKSTLKIN
jgi:hypothetical protein